MLIYNTQEYVWPHVVVSTKRKLKSIFVNFHNFEFETLQIQFAKTLIRKGCLCGSSEKQRGLPFVKPDDDELAAVSQAQSHVQFLVPKEDKTLCRKELSITVLTPSVSRASLCAILALRHGATFSCALHAREIFLPDDSWLASRAGFIKNMLGLFVISGGCGKFRKEKTERKKYCC